MRISGPATDTDGDARAEAIEDRRGDRHDARGRLVGTDRIAGLANLGERLVQTGAGGDGARAEAGEPGGDGIVDVGLRAVGEQHLARRRRVRGATPADLGEQAHHLRALQPVEVDDVGARQHGEVGGLVAVVVQLLQRHVPDLAQHAAADDLLADLVQLQAQPVAIVRPCVRRILRATRMLSSRWTVLFGNLTRRPSSETPSTGSANVNAVSSDNALATADSGDSLLAAIARETSDDVA